MGPFPGPAWAGTLPVPGHHGKARAGFWPPWGPGQSVSLIFHFQMSHVELGVAAQNHVRGLGGLQLRSSTEREPIIVLEACGLRRQAAERAARALGVTSSAESRPSPDSAHQGRLRAKKPRAFPGGTFPCPGHQVLRTGRPTAPCQAGERSAEVGPLLLGAEFKSSVGRCRTGTPKAAP